MKKRGFVTLSDYEALMVLGGANSDDHPWGEEAPKTPMESASSSTVEPDYEHPWDSD